MTQPDDPRRRGRSLEEWFTSAATLAGGIAALAGFVYLVGGMVMWLRFRTADLPPDQGVALMSKEQLFVIGLRLMIIPTLVTGTIAAVLADRAAHDGERGRTAVGWTVVAVLGVVAALLPIWSFAVARWPTGLAVLLDALIVTGALCLLVPFHKPAPDAEPVERHVPRWLAPAIAGTAAVLAVVLCVAVPDLRVDDRAWVRWLVAGAAALAMALPAGAVLAARLPRPRALVAWSAVGVAAVVAGVVAVPDWWARLAVVLGAAVVAGVLAALVLTWKGRGLDVALPRRWLGAALAIVVVGLIVPWSFASATWPLGLGLLIAVWLWRRHRLRAATGAAARARQRRRLTVVMAAAAVLAAAIVSIGRQLDEPVQLLHAKVSFKDGSASMEGAYVNASGDMVYVGDQDEGTIQAIPRSEVRDVIVGPPEERAPSPSLLSRILPGERRFSARPLEVWCDGERYGWFEARKLCRTQPELLWTTRVHDRFLDRLGMPVRIRCPADARDVCRGWVLFQSRAGYLHGRAGVPRPVIPDPVRFAVGPSKVTEVCATLTEGQLELLRDAAGENAVPFDVVLAHDEQGETVLDQGGYGLLVGPERIRDLAWNASDCEPQMTIDPAPDEDGLGVKVTARPRARGITPWHVRGSVRFTATRGHRPPLKLGTVELDKGAARLPVDLPPGRWVVTARYTSFAGLRYSEPSPELELAVPRSARPRR